MNTYTTLAVLAAATLLAACSTSPVASTQKVTIPFAAQINGQNFVCGQSYNAVGATASTITPMDFRLYVSGVKLIDAQGRAVPVQLEQDGVWQRGDVALLDFENAQGTCRYGHQPNAISPAAKRGEELFFGERMECYHCHGGFLFSDNIQHSRLPFPELGFHHTGLYNTDGRGTYPKGHEGLQDITTRADDHGLFRTPSLRNVAVTAPYMHDGSMATLHDVIRHHYAVAGRAATQGHGPSPLRSAFIEGFNVSDDEVNDLVAFLESLTDSEFLQNPRHGNPWTQKP